MLEDLKKFLLRGNVVDLAIAVVLGIAFGAVVSSFVGDIINPIIAAIFGEPDMRDVLAITLREGDGGDAVLRIGAFVDECINFVIIGGALFVVVQAFNKLQGMRRSTEPGEDPVPSDDVVLLTEIRDLLRTQRG
ncbi:MAG: large conductance mechanosensitive channel protein MscL [Acidimicrobiales bacterium]|nr:large conductance mechanosensitive channel protein MscL [Acidimicrobiales bacterium]